jgi:hypothetical protein
MKVSNRGSHASVVAGTIACLVIGAVVWRASHTEKAKRAPRVNDDISEGQATLPNESVSTAGADVAAAQAMPVAPVPARAPSVAQPVYAAEQYKPTTPSIGDQRAYLQMGFEKEPVDRAWARDAQRELSAAIQRQIAASASLTSVECRSSLCRADIAFDGPADYRSFLRESRPLWAGPSALIRVGSGDDWSMVAFFAKPGQPLPILE